MGNLCLCSSDLMLEVTVVKGQCLKYTARKISYEIIEIWLPCGIIYPLVFLYGAWFGHLMSIKDHCIINKTKTKEMGPLDKGKKHTDVLFSSPAELQLNWKLHEAECTFWLKASDLVVGKRATDKSEANFRAWRILQLTSLKLLHFQFVKPELSDFLT